MSKAPAPAYDTEQRFLLGVMSLCVLALLGAPAFDLLFVRDAWSYRLSVLTTYPRLISSAFVVAVGLIVPVLYCTHQRWALRLAVLGGCIGSFASYGMAYIGRNVDVGALLLSFLNGFAFYYLMAGTFSLVYSAALAVLLNGQMLHALHHGKEVHDESV